jgi:hypothetical protein
MLLKDLWVHGSRVCQVDTNHAHFELTKFVANLNIL